MPIYILVCLAFLFMSKCHYFEKKENMYKTFIDIPNCKQNMYKGLINMQNCEWVALNVIKILELNHTFAK